jgi:hypothetical protein
MLTLCLNTPLKIPIILFHYLSRHYLYLDQSNTVQTQTKSICHFLQNIEKIHININFTNFLKFVHSGYYLLQRSHVCSCPVGLFTQTSAAGVQNDRNIPSVATFS